MVICKTVASLKEYLSTVNQRKGFVPTMGALHEGHASLIRESKAGARFTIVSLFVNPTQFNDPKDFEKYPKTLEPDILLAARAGADVLFLPSLDEVYPQGTAPVKHYELGYLETVLEGRYRPGHFQGVCQVVERLLRIVAADDLYMGQKDYQQCMVVRRLIETEQIPVTLVVSSIRREIDGLAMSSRNLRLDATQRIEAVAIFQVLERIRKHFVAGEPLGPLKADSIRELESRGFRVDYVEIADAVTLDLLDTWEGFRPAVALIAAYLGEVRLIDNELLNLL